MIRDADFDWVCTTVREQAAIVLDERKRYLVESRLEPLAREHGFPGLSELVFAVRSGRRRDLLEAIVDAMTTNETSFFRDGLPWRALRDHVLPDIIARRASSRRLRLWSAACSTGQEPYTLAMMLAQHFPRVRDWDVEILATDISARVLDQAREGTYRGHELSRGLDPALRDRFFTADGQGRFHLDPVIRDRVSFRRMNLAAPWPGFVGQYDIIFVRNVLIYFDVGTKRSILSRMEKHLQPDGYLLLGSGETTLNMGLGLRRLQAERAWFYQHG